MGQVLLQSASHGYTVQAPQGNGSVNARIDALLLESLVSNFLTELNNVQLEKLRCSVKYDNNI
jgi:hypothetical protein